MAESFLREQLERIRALTERMTAVQNRAAELSNEIAHHREAMQQSPLHEVRDYRTYSSLNTDEPRQSPARGRRRHRR